jgi:hypothetical protein
MDQIFNMQENQSLNGGLTLSLLYIYIYIYGAPSKARNLTSYIYKWTRFCTGDFAS